MDTQIVTTLTLTDFRNFTQKEIVFDSRQTLICAPNGSGKTNIIESLSFLSTGRSFRAKILSDCVRSGSDIAHVTCSLTCGQDTVDLRAHIVSRDGQYAARSSTQYEKNGVKKQTRDFVGTLKSVVFRPEDLEIVTDGPSYRRAFLDDLLVQTNTPYRRSLQEYEKALKHRNKLILQLRDGTATRKDFFFWDTLLIKHGDVLTRARKHFLLALQEYVAFPIPHTCLYQESIISEERLHQYAMEEVAAGRTLVGPHRDDFFLSMQSEKGEMLDVARFGSRGQQRMSVLWLKIGALQYIEKETSQTPVLLLDDIFSELDERNREHVLSLFPGRQVILTSAEEKEMLPKECALGKILLL